MTITQNDIRLGRKIKKSRRQADITQEKLAEKAGVSTTHIGLVETGKRKVSLQTLKKIASSLGIKVRDLIPF